MDKKETRICNKCGEEKPIEDFPITKSHTGKAKYRRRKCKECYREEARRSYYERKI